MNQAIARAIENVGGVTKLAKKVGVSHQAVGKWLKNRPPAERVVEIERATGGAVSREELRPDLYLVSSSSR